MSREFTAANHKIPRTHRLLATANWHGEGPVSRPGNVVFTSPVHPRLICQPSDYAKPRDCSELLIVTASRESSSQSGGFHIRAITVAAGC
jgi:hypothetical protein